MIVMPKSATDMDSKYCFRRDLIRGPNGTFLICTHSRPYKMAVKVFPTLVSHRRHSLYITAF